MSSTLNTLALTAAAALLAATTACTLEPLASDDDESLAPRDCEPPLCGFNSPRINDAPFPELHLGGLANDAGVSLVGLRSPTSTEIYELKIEAHQALAAYSGTMRVAHGAGLVGWQLVLDDNGTEVSGTIRAFSRATASWATGNDSLTTYAISFPSPVTVGLDLNVCPTYVNDPNTPVLTVIPGQTYDREAKLVGLIDSSWATFACADEAAYKAKRLGYAEVLGFDGTALPATRAQQDATLKMITADYCGKGKSFTEPNTPVYWENTALTVPMGPPANERDTIEAIWTDYGALCLDNPRIPGMLAKIQADCELPSCDTIDLEEVSHEWISWPAQ